jgi:hypothetical protein
MIRSSGSANLAKDHDCSFSFLEMTGVNSDSVPIPSAFKQACANDMQMEAQVMVHGTRHDFWGMHTGATTSNSRPHTQSSTAATVSSSQQSSTNSTWAHH